MRWRGGSHVAVSGRGGASTGEDQIENDSSHVFCSPSTPPKNRWPTLRTHCQPPADGHPPAFTLLPAFMSLGSCSHTPRSRSVGQLSFDVHRGPFSRCRSKKMFFLLSESTKGGVLLLCFRATLCMWSSFFDFLLSPALNEVDAYLQ